jgi:hypothetical protein
MRMLRCEAQPCANCGLPSSSRLRLAPSLGRKVDRASTMRVVFTQNTLCVQAAQAPARISIR